MLFFWEEITLLNRQWMYTLMYSMIGTYCTCMYECICMTTIIIIWQFSIWDRFHEMGPEACFFQDFNFQ